MTPSTSSPVKQALLALEQMRAKAEQFERSQTEPIAIVGMACRVPGAADSEGFWQLLRDGRDVVGEIGGVALGRRRALRRKIPTRRERCRPVGRVFLDRIDGFEPEFFGISPREAGMMDPQQRLLLEVAWEALENAGQCASATG